jgi:hypothetical protein
MITSLKTEVLFLAKARIFSLLHCVQTGSAAHPASYPVGTWGWASSPVSVPPFRDTPGPAPTQLRFSGPRLLSLCGPWFFKESVSFHSATHLVLFLLLLRLNSWFFKESVSFHSLLAYPAFDEELLINLKIKLNYGFKIYRSSSFILKSSRFLAT